MLKNYSGPIRLIISGIMETYTQESMKNDDFDYMEKIDFAKDNIYRSIEATGLITLTDEDKQEIDDQIREYIFQSDDVIPTFEANGYKPWLDDVKANIIWKHRDLYFKYLLQVKKWSVSQVNTSIDRTTDIILDHMANPKGENYFVKRGLVIGDVQSGKTANYTALINKAIDVGYKLVIVLAGQQNDLRTQTQERLDKEVLGYETSYNSRNVQSGENIGVGLLHGYTPSISSLTNRGNNGDFKKSTMTMLIENGDPVIAVVKKNTTVLKNLFEFLNKPINLNSRGKIDFPVLIIDDEVDQASVNTKKDPDDDPTRINGRIRDIVNLCNKVSYVGYTATPYANVLIDSNVNNDTYGEDLFPKDFIIVLPTSKDYCGVEQFFGADDDINTDLVEYVDDEYELVDLEDGDCFKLKAKDEIIALSTSLKDAIHDFIIASSVRRSRGEITHNGMMVHIAAYKKPATSLTELLNDYIYELKNEFRFDNDIAIEKYKSIWETRFRLKSKNRGHEDNWFDIESQLSSVIELLKVKLLNGDSKDVVDYTETSQSQIIAVGGNKLSRGITLEGLMISYYLRDPRAYDTAMQMGRWFGYKKSYLDLCRIYSQRELLANFVHIMDATRILRNDITVMNDECRTPLEFGLKLLSHPTMLPTARNKMRSGRKLDISFSEQRVETTRFDERYIKHNKDVFNNFVNDLKKDDKVIVENEETPVFRNCSYNQIMKLLNSYKDIDDSFLGNVDRWKSYIDRLHTDGELTNWTVVISTATGGERSTVELGGFDISKAHRSILSLDSTYKSIRVITKPSDFKYFLKDDILRDKYKRGYVKDDSTLRSCFNNKEALLVVYPIDITLNDKVVIKDVFGFGIWFPYTTNKNAYANYIVNSVYSEEIEGDSYEED